MRKETCMSDKRDLTCAQVTAGIRVTISTEKAYIYDKRDPHTRQKRPTYATKETNVSDKRELTCAQVTAGIRVTISTEKACVYDKRDLYIHDKSDLNV